MQVLELAAGGVTALESSQGDRKPRPLFLGATLVVQGLTLPLLIRRSTSTTTAARSARSCSGAGAPPTRR